MELSEIKSAWKAYDVKLDKALKLNLYVIESLQSQNVRAKLTPVFWQRIIELALHVPVLVLLLIFLFENLSILPYAGSALLLIAFYATLIMNCLKQINILNRLDYRSDVVALQSSLTLLQTNILNHARMAILFMPAFLAYPVVVSKAIKDHDIGIFGDFDIVAQSGGNWWTAQLVATVVLIPLGIWSYKQITYRNIDKKWVRNFIQRSTGRRVRESIEYLKELKDLKNDVI
jgi:hypothetical protein